MTKFWTILKKYSLLSFFTTLIFLLGLIYLGNEQRKKKLTPDTISEYIPLVQTFYPQQQQLSASAKITHEGLIEIIAQTSGVVQKINLQTGQKILRGQTLLNLSSNYQGANIPALQLALSQERWLTEHANFWDNLHNDQVRQDIAQLNTHQTIALSNSAYTTYIAGQNQIITERNQDIGNRNQQLNLDNTEVNLKLAQINASLMYPASPVAGVVEKIFVNKGQLINPGQTLALVRAKQNQIKLELSLNEKILPFIDFNRPATLTLPHQTYLADFAFISTVPSQGYNYQITLLPQIETELASNILPHGSFVNINLPLKNQANSLLVPLNAIYLTQNANYVFVLGYNEAGETIARQKQLTLGPILGDLVVIQKGLENNDIVLLNLNLIDQQVVQIAES